MVSCCCECIYEKHLDTKRSSNFASHSPPRSIITGDLTGIISERDYISKVDLLDRDPATTKVREIFTPSSKLVTANVDETVQLCMEKMLASDIRHLPLVDHGKLIGMISIKDLVKTCIKEQEQTIKVLSDFALGKSSYSC